MWYPHDSQQTALFMEEGNAIPPWQQNAIPTLWP
jgi:hypothetical protein